MRDLFSLEGKIALVTGGSVGIGAMIAEGFVNFGAKVYIVARREEVLKKKQEELAKIGLCEHIAADVSSVAGITELAKAYGEREQSLDILVNNAGISDGGRKIEDITEETWDAVLDLRSENHFLYDPGVSTFPTGGGFARNPAKCDQYSVDRRLREDQLILQLCLWRHQSRCHSVGQAFG